MENLSSLTPVLVLVLWLPCPCSSYPSHLTRFVPWPLCVISIKSCSAGHVPQNPEAQSCCELAPCCFMARILSVQRMGRKRTNQGIHSTNVFMAVSLLSCCSSGGYCHWWGRWLHRTVQEKERINYCFTIMVRWLPIWDILIWRPLGLSLPWSFCRTRQHS